MLRSRNGNKRDGQYVSSFPQHSTQVRPAVHFKRQDSVDNAITGICNAIVEAHQTPMKVEVTDESKQVMEEGRNKMLQREEELFKNHEAAIGRSVQTLEIKFKNVVDGFKGVWVDKKTFNRYYWGFIGLLEIAICALCLLIFYWVKFGAPWNC